MEPIKKGLVITVGPDTASFGEALLLASAALDRSEDVYCYCVDEAVRGVSDIRLKELTSRGMKLFACAYGARRRGLPLEGPALFSGLGMLSDIIAHTHSFHSF